jgi:hypothetical protein
MKRAMFALMLGSVILSSSGCCFIDRILHVARYGFPRGGCYPEGGCYQEGQCCAPGGGCMMGGPAPGDACDMCGDAMGPTGPLVGRHRPSAADNGPAGPPTGTVAYPYYTTRGPRDFFAKHPGPIGP